MHKTKNIGGDPNDLHYRYKRDIIETIHTNKKGGQTTLTNINTIIKNQLKMPSQFVTAFYKQIKKKGHAMIDKGVFRGTIQVSEFEKILEKMIKKFVLCPKCGNPEWAGGPTCPACGYGRQHQEVLSVSELTEKMDMKDGDSNESKITELMHTLYDEREKTTDDERRRLIDTVLDRMWVVNKSSDAQKIMEKYFSELL